MKKKSTFRKALVTMTALAVSTMMLTTYAADGTTADSDQSILSSLRVKTTQAFSQDAVNPDDLAIILEAGLAAPSAINQQPWYFAVVTNKDIMSELSGDSSGASAGGQEGAESAGEESDGAESEDAEAPDAESEGGDSEDAEAPDAESEGGDSEDAEAPDAESEDGESEGGQAAASSAKASLGDSPVAIIVYKSTTSSSPNADFDCGLACQNIIVAANALGYGAKIISSPTMTLNGDSHDSFCEKLGVDTSMEAVAVILIGYADTSVDGSTGATERSSIDEKVSFVE